ncbi:MULTISPECIES: hypothetical protein [Exiguobacterium]|uniref:hypothetical protein n=1 Tax=Exiguobacterium TaxID=33986 RepID=UPI001BE8BA88|nr:MULTISPECIES: hypothetical protein [Exiguobacterium]MCT4793380.1 hypothetical protein [Exiguobacterium artemiae]
MTNGKIALRVLGVLIGAIVGLLIVYEAKGTFDVSVLLGFVVGALIFALINIIWVRIKRP